MGKLVVLRGDGDLKLSWNSGNDKEIDAAKEIFEKRKKDGWSAFGETSTGRRGEKIKEFDPDMERIVLIPPISGGCS